MRSPFLAPFPGNRLVYLYALVLVIVISTILGSNGFSQVPVIPLEQVEWLPTEIRLREAISSSDPERKRDALFEIRSYGSERASRLAIPALTDSTEIVRATAVSSVMFLPESEAARLILPLLADKAPFVRREAAHALGRVGNWSATSHLIRTLSNDRDREVRSAAAVALGDIGDYSALDALTRVLRKKPTEDDEFLRRSACRSIGQIFDLITDGNTDTVNPQNFLPSKFKEFGDGANIKRISRTIDLDGIVTTLSQVLQNSKEADDTRREAAFALGSLRQPASTDVLRNYLNSPDPYLAEISKEALLKIENQ